MGQNQVIAGGKAELRMPAALYSGICACLNEILKEGSYADKAVSVMLKSHPSWGSRDRKTAAALIYQIVRKKFSYAAFLQSKGLTEEELTDTMIMLAVQEIPSIASLLTLNDTAFSSASFDEFCRGRQHLKWSMSEWLYHRFASDWGSIANDILSSLDHPAPVYLRMNLLKAKRDRLTEELQKLAKVELLNDFPAACKVEGANQLRNSRPFRDGMFEFQDLGSQVIGQACRVKPGETVIDWCAGKGGKTLQLAVLMKNTGRLLASDIDQRRLEVLQRRAQKAGAKIIETITAEELSKLRSCADVILIDAPCSGSGTFRRQPDLKFRLQENELEDLLPIQAGLLDAAAEALKPGARLVYATCSLLKCEDEQQILSFIDRQKELGRTFEVIEERYLLPAILDTDGFYYAVLHSR